MGLEEVVRGLLASDDGNCNYNPMHLAQKKAIIVSFLYFIEKFWQDCYSNSFPFSSVQPNGILKINYLNRLKTASKVTEVSVGEKANNNRKIRYKTELVKNLYYRISIHLGKTI